MTAPLAPTLRGVLPVFQTPYHADETIDFDTLEQEIRDGDARLGDPMFYAQRADEVGAWMEALDARRAKLDVMMARWEELEKRRDVKKS